MSVGNPVPPTKRGSNKRQVTLGDIYMWRWKDGDPLFPEWYEPKEKAASIDPEEVVLEPEKRYLLVIDYPLSRDFVQPIDTVDKGLTRRELVSLITQCYKRIYRDEGETTSVTPDNIPGMLNRITTNGVYGIWGHDLSDLALHTAYIDGNLIKLGVDS